MFGNGARTVFLSACHLKLDARFGQDLSLPLRAARQKPRPHLRQGFFLSDRPALRFSLLPPDELRERRGAAAQG